jgi:hypothetical protein
VSPDLISTVTDAILDEVRAGLANLHSLISGFSA